MAYIEGEQRTQHTLFPTTLDELIPQDHVCRVIEAFVSRLDMAKLGFVRSEPAEQRRYGYQFGDAVTGPDGEIVFGEDDNNGHLWLYFPRIKRISLTHS
jgi:hypothetical protein